MRKAAWLALALIFFVAGIGPWPVYTESRHLESGYYARAVRAIGRGARRAGVSSEAGRLRAGWASVDMTPPVGVTLAGYRPRANGLVSTGVHDPLGAYALALGDGTDTALLLVADLLIVPPAIADAVRARLAVDPGLPADRILFNATHTHSGPGGFAPGLGPRITGGPYDPEIEKLVIDRLTGAARAALSRMQPAAFASGAVAVPERIENRAREGPVDDELALLSIRRDDGARCLLVSYAAHPTVVNRKHTELSRDYPGALQDHLHAATGADVIFASGAVGSMGDDPPRVSRDRWRRADAMGSDLADRLVARGLDALVHQTHADVAAFGVPIGMPELQVRSPWSRWLRFSPWGVRALGMPDTLWLQLLRVGPVLFVGLPFDFSGETSLDWKAWAAQRGLDLWPTSFNGAYGGYLTPDRHYLESPLDYETSWMSWYGPDAEAYLTDLFRLAVAELDL